MTKKRDEMTTLNTIESDKMCITISSFLNIGSSVSLICFYLKNLNIVKEEFVSCQALIEQARSIIKGLETKLSAANVPYIRKTNEPKN